MPPAPPADDLVFAPPPVTVDGLRAVPMDIQSLDASVFVDVANRGATSIASMHFRTGIEDGCPLFDIRQDIGLAVLDLVKIPTEDLAPRDLGGGPDAGMRLVPRVLTAGTVHKLDLHYALEQPQAEGSQSIEWVDGGLWWDFFFSDLWAGRYLEMWFPANLCYDRFAFSLELNLNGTEREHTLVTNGHVEQRGRNHWRVEFPERFTSLSPLLVLGPTDEVQQVHGDVTLPDTGKTVNISVYKRAGTEPELNDALVNIRPWLRMNVRNYGPYLHGDSFTAFLWEGTRSMEYEGGVTSNETSLEHEVFHSWFARGVKPASQNDGWIDEAWTMYNTGPMAFAVIPFDPSEPPVTLSPAHPYSRITPRESYTAGCRFFAGLAALMGREMLVAAMAAFYREHMGGFWTTRSLEDHLAEFSGQPEVHGAFDRWVRGQG